MSNQNENIAFPEPFTYVRSQIQQLFHDVQKQIVALPGDDDDAAEMDVVLTELFHVFFHRFEGFLSGYRRLDREYIGLMAGMYRLQNFEGVTSITTAATP